MSKVVASLFAAAAAQTAFAFTSPLSTLSTSSQRIPSESTPLHVSNTRFSHSQCILHATTSDGEGNSFESLGLSNDLVAVAERMNWEVPTPVQQLSIPAILNMADGGNGGSSEGTSLWCEGPTGSGKTGGFSLPLLQILLQRQNLENHQGGDGQISTLILCPTRELAAQTGDVIQRLISHLPRGKKSITTEVIYGGVPMEAQVARLAKKRSSGDDIDIVVATPGRLVDVLKKVDNIDDPTLSALERRILDAFDEKNSASSDNNYNKSGGKKKKKGRGRRGSPSAESSLTLNDIQELDLDRVDDDGRATLDEMLHNLDYLVLDEADRLLGGAFKDDIDALLSLFPKTRIGGRDAKATMGETKLKTLLFSATFPEQIEERVDRVLSRMSVGTPLRVSTTASMMQRVSLDDDDDDDDLSSDAQLSNRQKKHLAKTTAIKSVLPDTAPSIGHRVIRLDERDRTQALRHLLEQNSEEEWDRVLVFVGTRYSTEHVTRKLRRYGIAAAELHGKLDQAARERRLKSFRSGKTRVLISTDLAARGIDVEGLPVVVNYDLPRSAADFTHRNGRTGRAGKTGSAISFVSAKSESHFDFIEKKEMHHRIEHEVLPGFEPNEDRWEVQSAASTMSVPGATHSERGLEHDKTFGGIKGRKKSKKDKLREAAAKKARQNS